MENACCCRWYINVIMYYVYAMKILQGLMFNPKHLIFNEFLHDSPRILLLLLFSMQLYILFTHFNFDDVIKCNASPYSHVFTKNVTSKS